MNGQVKFWTAIGTEEQLDFEGRVHIKEVPVGDVHIVYSEILMCRQSRDRLKGELKAKKHKVVQIRPKGKLCEKCEKNYKNHPDLAFMRWINPPEPKRANPIQINPQLLEKQ